MDAKFAKERSKLLSSILRHNPGKIGATLDVGGWVDVDVLLAGLAKMGRRLSRDDLTFIIENNDKKRFTLSEDGLRIRAAQGHSVDIESDLATAVPPSQLFHGTASRFVDQILQEGLKPMRRTHVHLSVDLETAIKVGQRHGKPVVLVVDCLAMSQQGHPFFVADNGVWLAHDVPPQYLTRFDGESS
jgi:putative RNA 2'-phosphotransferase